MRDSEKIYEIVFGKTLSDYQLSDLEEFIHPFEVRFERNGISANEIFEGKNCLDAGCGNGRGSFFMLRHGAARVEAVDLSENNISSTTKFAEQLGYADRINVTQCSLEEIPFADGEFDFVWCNGVIMHAHHPNACLLEISRVVREGGAGWLYIYGSGGLYWKVMQRFRDLLSDIDVLHAIQYLKVFRYSPRYIGEFIDDWYAAHLRTYTHMDLATRLTEIGFEKPERLVLGMDYDTSQRRELAEGDLQRELTGEGDLRYLLSKTGNAPKNDALLDEGVYGSEYQWPESVESLVVEGFGIIPELDKTEPWKRVAICARVQREFRILMDKKTQLDRNEFLNIFHMLRRDSDLI